jgi:agmatinase|uniref:Agmatinase n=1 Tax=Desulfobacca acetoxidans TaxID=60893 RepID=A0A7V6A3P7_9BACT
MSFPNFLDLKFLPVKEAEAIILPIPYEATTTYGSGTRHAPEAILAASRQVELWDEEDCWDPSAAIRIATVSPLTAEVSGPKDMLDKIRKNVQSWVAQGKTVLALGGEHTVTCALVQSVQTKYPDLTIVALDAHADMRDSYDGSKLSHACALKRVYDLGRPLTTLGVRSYSQEESQLAWVAPRYTMFKAKDLHSPEGWERALDHLQKISGPVYVSIDADVFDPAILPGVGTPEPGGLSYYQVLTLIKTVAQRGPVVGLDLVEVSPIPGHRVSEFTAARVLYKALGYMYLSRRAGNQ